MKFKVILCLLLFINVTYANISPSMDNLLRVETEKTFGSQVDPELMFQYVSAGVPHIFWKFINSSNFEKLQFVSAKCKKSLSTVSNSFQSHLLTAYKFLDASGKTPSGLTRAAMTSLGDFDLCISINDQVDEVNLIGKYCAYDAYPIDTSSIYNEKSSNESINLNKIPIFGGVPFIHSICLPSDCSVIEIRQMLSTGK